VYLALKEAEGQKGLITSVDYLRHIAINYLCDELLVFVFCMAAVRSYKIVWEYYVLVDDFVVLLAPGT
jgi:hypothetical protein